MMPTTAYDEDTVPQKLKDWIGDGDTHAQNLSPKNVPQFLYKAEFSEIDLCHAFIYAGNRLADASVSLRSSTNLAVKLP